MKCPRCAAENDQGARFCEDCGARLELACPSCGERFTPGKKFCRSCGAALTAEAHRFTSPQSYTPKHLAERILISRSAVEGERKQVTVLFADMKGSMELLADRDPEEARKILDPVLDRMMEAVHHYEGTVNQVMGDGIMALFGAPLALEDHAVRACYAALRMQESVKRYAERLQRNAGIPVQIRIGLNAGDVVVRSIGNDLHMDYTAVGQTTHLAARMEQMAMAGSILLSANALRLAEGLVQVNPLGAVAVKGLSEAVEAYELIGAGAARTRLQVSVARGLSRFVGRDTEIDTLRRAIEKAGRSHGQVVGVVGEPGVGKSRLFWEFTHSHRTHGWLLLDSGSVSYGKATPYLPVIDLLKAYFKVQDRDGHREVREKVTGKLLTLDRSLEPTLPAFFALLDVPDPDPAWQSLDPPQRRQRTLEAVKRLLLRETQVQPLLVIFEDLHWIDGETQALLDGLIESLPAARVLLLVNYRPEYQHHWGSKTYYSQLRLDTLPSESAGELLTAVLGSDASLEPLKEVLIARTGGNPFFLEESVRTLVETRVLIGERAAYRLEKPLAAIQIPASVRAVLAARIDRLPADEKQLLQSVAVIGKDVPFLLLQAIVELPDETLRRGVAHLQAAEFLYETSLFPDLEYTFKHALTHEVAYGSLLQERRQAVHARIVAAVEHLYADRLAEQVERLAYHALRGEVWDKAVAYFRRAGARAFARSANREAVACFEQALDALQQLPESRSTVEEAIDLRLDATTAIFPLGEIRRVFEYLRQAEPLAERLLDQPRQGRLSAFLSNYFWVVGDLERALESAERVLAIATALSDSALQIQGTFRLGQAHLRLGDYRRATEFLTLTMTSVESDRVRDRFGFPFLPSVASRAWLAWCLAELGEFAEGRALGYEAIRIAEAADQPLSRIIASLGMGHLGLSRGDLEPTVQCLERGLELCTVFNLAAWWSHLAATLGAAYALAGRPGDARRLLEQADDARSSVGAMGGLALYAAWLSETYLLAGRKEDAIQHADRALDLSRRHKERGHEALTLRLLGDIAACEDPPDVERAASHYRQALTLADELRMRPLIAHCHLGLGKLHRNTGSRDKAHDHLTSARTMYREIEMPFWLEQAEAELARLR
jgi:class 3 adenylate cyclase/tetratricopeptide (TPR) repeat protein